MKQVNKTMNRNNPTYLEGVSEVHEETRKETRKKTAVKVDQPSNSEEMNETINKNEMSLE